MTYNVLIFDDQPDQQHSISQVVSQRLGYRTITADSVDYGMGWINSPIQPQPDVVIIDLPNNNDGVLKIVRQAKAYKPQLPVIVMTPYGQEEYAAPAVAAGATDFLAKPTSLERIRLSINNVLKIQHMAHTIARLERKHCGLVNFSDLVGECKGFASAVSAAKMAANSSFPVWIEGEAGAGRELMARAIHGSGPRAGKNFTVMNCEHMQDGAAEALLLAKLREAEQGTLYFHEITLLPFRLQQRVLEAVTMQDVNTRVICSNSKDTNAAVAKGIFGHVFYDCLRKMIVPLPPLRERKQDIVPLALNFLRMHAASENKFPATLSEDAAALLENHPWPGNIRQMGNLLMRAVLFCQQDQMDAGTLRLIQQLEPVNYNASRGAEMPEFFDRKGQIKKLRSIEEDAIKLALKHANGCMTKAARNLGIGRSTLYRKLDEFEASSYMQRENQTTRPMMPASVGEAS